MPGGRRGRAEGTATAAMTRRKDDRPVSPPVIHDPAGRIMRRNGAGPVHKPARGSGRWRERHRRWTRNPDAPAPRHPDIRPGIRPDTGVRHQGPDIRTGIWPGTGARHQGPDIWPDIWPGTGTRHQARHRAIQGARSGRPGSATRRDRCRIPRCPANRPGAKGPAGLRPPGGRQRHRRPAPRPAPPCLAMPRPAPGEAAQADRNTRLATLAIRMRKPGLPAPCVTVLPRPPARPGKALCPAAGLAALITRSPARRGASPRARGVRISASDRRATRAAPEPPGQRPTPLPHPDPPEA